MLTSLVLSLAGVFAGSPALGETPPPVLGETPPKGPPWLLTYRDARRDALLNGRPVMVYFTKTH